MENENNEIKKEKELPVPDNPENEEDQSELLEAEDLHRLLIVGDKEGLAEKLNENSAVQLAEALNPLHTDEAVLFYSLVQNDYDKLGEIFSYLYIEKRIALVEHLNKKIITAVLQNVSNDDLADFLGDLKKQTRDKVLSFIPNKRKLVINYLSKYSDDTVGSIMTTEFLTIPSGSTVQNVLDKIKAIGNTLETVRTIFVIDKANKLIGTERLESLMFEDENTIIDDVMQKDFAYISPIADKEQAVPICEEYDLPVLPVVSKAGEMLGILTFDDVMDVLEEENTEDVLKQGAVSPTQRPYMENKIFNIARSYVIWLIVLLVINTFTGIIVSRFESALLTLPILISFVPALNDSTGNSGSQTTSMVIRALTTENVEKKDYLKIIGKEALTGLITGLIVALFNFGWVMLELNTPLLNVTESMKKTLLEDLHFQNLANGIQYGYMLIAGIVSAALFFGILFSKIFASILPLIAKVFHIDPALMSGPLVSSLMDIMTLLLYFGIAIMVIDSINPGLLKM